MTSLNDARYRLKLAQGFLAEARQDLELKRWRSAVDNAQLSVENSAKAVLVLAGFTGKTHNTGDLLREALDREEFTEEIRRKMELLAQYTDELGFEVHVRTDYGDETEGKTPWELFDEDDAREAVEIAERSSQIAEAILKCFIPDALISLECSGYP
ncbi:HEPN domain-containing protein [Candidatus Poribacteria bacterium]|nr:HEPN domain-containing protein [Candidatus Poribacteria bacterium]